MPQISTPVLNQSAIIKFFKEELSKNPEVSIVQNSRGGQHLRINYKGDVYSLLNSILPCELTSSDVVISGKFETKELKINKSIPGANSGDKIYLVVTVSSKGILSNKELTPDKLNFGGKTINKSSLKTEANAAIAKSKVPQNIKTFLSKLLDASESVTGDIKSELIESISDSDLNIIAKDFGEISGALWFMSQQQKNSNSVFYPKEINSPLVDYYVNVGNKKIAISAKANKGAPPSINAIADVLRKMSAYSDPKKEAARKAIIAISDKSTVDGIIEASKNLQTPGYIWLKSNIFKRDFSALECENALTKYKTVEEITKLMSPFYSTINRSASSDIIGRILSQNKKRYGIIISPLGYSLVDQLNANSVYSEVLNDAASSIVVSQLYMNINKTYKKVNYEIKEFSSSKFIFFYNANAGEPSLKKISFKMS